MIPVESGGVPQITPSMNHSLGQRDLPALLTPREVASMLRVGYATVQIWAKTGAIPAVKIGKAYRIRREDLEAWFEARRKE